MNQIRGLEVVAKEIRRNDKDPDYRIACIRDYIIAHKGEVMKMEDLSYAAYGLKNSSALHHIKNLRRQGRLTRKRIGKSFTYEWHNPRPEGWSKQPEVHTRPMTEEERTAAGIPSSEAVSSTLNDTFGLDVVVSMAKDFAWSQESDSLRAFIKHLEISNRKEQ